MLQDLLVYVAVEVDTAVATLVLVAKATSGLRGDGGSNVGSISGTNTCFSQAVELYTQ